MTKNLLITGINGFIGSYCKAYFANKGLNVYGIDMAGCSSNETLIAEVTEENIKSFNKKFDYIVHLAGSRTVSASQKNPDVEKNKSVGSCKEVLEYIKNYNPKAKMIFSSSASVYGDDYSGPILERDKVNPISIYGSHKLEAENLCKYYNEQYGLNIEIPRIFSVYGNGLRKQLLWDFSNRILNAEKKLDCFGTGDELRDFVHISDLVRFFEILMLQNEKFGIYNCASGVSTSVKEIMQLILKFNDKTLDLVFDNIEREGNPKILIADISKAESIGFSPKKRIEKGIKEYVEWFKNN